MLDDLGNLGDFIGGIGVVFSLIYLAMQIRRNTASVQAASIDSATRAVWEFMELLARDVELLRLYNAGIRDFRGLSQEDRFRFASLLSALLHRVENMVAQNRRGLLPKDAWEGATARIQDTFGFPGTLQWWDGGKHAFNQEFRNWIDTEIISESSEERDA